VELNFSKEFLQILSEASITPSQFEIYVYLLKNGPSSITDISSNLKKDKGVVYKHIESLMRAGLVEKDLRKGLFIARNVDDFRNILSETLEDSYKKKKEKLEEVFKQLSDKLTPGFSYAPPEYRLIFGRKRLYNELKTLFDQTFYEYRLIMSGNGLLRSIRHGLLDSYLGMINRGVSVMIISEVNTENIKEASYLYEHIPFKHLAGVQIRLNIFDNDRVLIGAIQHDEDMNIKRPDDSYILIKDLKLAKGLIILFETLWTSAKDAGELIEKIKYVASEK
jgi:sugar-specific transcriptional regulator TrmB